ncbi:MAG: hypothetical protein KAU24_03825 [Candidatus Aenigmarchaeota archaeon]|nr:hypothetical protein [Candidatus Aenigmarchaeota archaeon]
MKEAFKSQRISGDRQLLIGHANTILESYAAEGYRLTLRQLYYQLVARNIIPNRVQEYAKLSNVMVAARMCGHTDWDFLEDRLRIPYREYAVHNVQEALEDTISQYKRFRQEGQPYCIEVWTEKDAVSNILKRVTEWFHVNLMVNRGYSSCSAMYRAAERFKQFEESVNVKILYVGDHDPSGLDMLRDIRERLYEFDTANFEVVHVALTYDQIQEFHPPPNPAKTTDPRSTGYIAEHGENSWELDALSPRDLERIVREAVEEFLDKEQFGAIVEEERDDIAQLEKVVNDLGDIK